MACALHNLTALGPFNANGEEAGFGGGTRAVIFFAMKQLVFLG
jgi:hypothetical protein